MWPCVGCLSSNLSGQGGATFDGTYYSLSGCMSHHLINKLTFTDSSNNNFSFKKLLNSVT